MKKYAILIFVLTTLVLVQNNYASGQTDSSAVTESSVMSAEESGSDEHELPSPFMVIPFVLLLTGIATGPLFYSHFWEHNYPKIAIALGFVTTIYYLLVLRDTLSLMHTLAEYLSFIALLSSLFIASGGILIKIDKASTPLLNTGILLFGAVIANIIGTTGASMLLIRPFIKINQNRIKAYHIIFFIFIVSNIGGALTPIGDPPLFLGYLRGVDFFWFVDNIWYIWLPTVIALLLIFYFIDNSDKSGEDTTEYTEKFEFKGLRNIGFLLIILISVFLDPGVMSWVPSLAPLPFGIREIIMFSVCYFAYKTSDDDILRANEFEFEPIKEVAYLFVGIFATMIPALQLISHEANVLGDKIHAGEFFWATGLLSGVLDNAPTYLNFLSAALGKYGMNVNSIADVNEFQTLHPLYLQAISVGAVFFGAMTYIGNGPNFMVKSISERAGIKMPSFFAYVIKYSLPILIPVFTLVWLIFYNTEG